MPELHRQSKASEKKNATEEGYPFLSAFITNLFNFITPTKGVPKTTHTSHIDLRFLEFIILIFEMRNRQADVDKKKRCGRRSSSQYLHHNRRNPLHPHHHLLLQLFWRWDCKNQRNQHKGRRSKGEEVETKTKRECDVIIFVLSIFPDESVSVSFALKRRRRHII